MTQKKINNINAVAMSSAIALAFAIIAPASAQNLTAAPAPAPAIKPPATAAAPKLPAGAGAVAAALAPAPASAAASANSAAAAAAAAAPEVNRNGVTEVGKNKIKRTTPKTVEPYVPIDPKGDAMPVPEVELFVGESRLFPTPGVARIAVGNGGVVGATALDDKDVLITGNGIGTSSLFVWNEDGRYQRIRVTVVPGETSRVAREVAAFLTRIPKATASVVGDKVIVEGDELSDADREKVAEMAKRYPQIVNFTSPIGWEQTVLMDVKVVEFPKSELRELGLKWNPTGGGAIGAIWMPSGRGDVGGRAITITSPTTQQPPITTIGQSGGNVSLPNNLTILSALNIGLNAQLTALEQNGTASILAEPQLSSRSGYRASFLAGGEFPYSISNANGTTVVFKPYGIKLDIEPRVGRNGVIRAQIDSEVSSIDGTVTSVGGPALLTRRTRTEFNVQAGQTIVLSGLLQRTSSNDVDKVPLLGDLPVLGALFRSKRFQNKETELVVFVTPTIIDSRSPGLVDRVEKAGQRLGATLGRTPYLSEPLQPDTNASKAHLPEASIAPSMPEGERP
jgi:pilus assembly protein CpaC